MAEPVFKLLRCDAEASHMFGWAKKEVRRLIDFARLDAFNRTWKFGDVSVKAHYFGGIARLWLEAEATERLAVWMTLPNPQSYRGVVLGMVDRGRPTRQITNLVSLNAGAGESPPEGNIYVSADVALKNSAGEILSQYVSRWVVYEQPIAGDPLGTKLQTIEFTLCTTTAQYESFLTQVETFIPRPTGEWVVFSGFLSGYWDVIHHNVWTSASGAWVDLGYEAALAADEQARTGGKAIEVVTSDGELLGYEPVTISGYTLGTTLWNGSGTTTLFETIGGITSPHHDLFFDVPEDCIYPITEIPPAYPGTGLPGTWEADWVAAVEQGKEREKAWLQKVSQETLTALRDGTLTIPTAWEYALKKNAPTSNNTRRPVLLTATYSDETVSDSSSNLTSPGVKITQRSTLLSYATPTEAGLEHHEASVVGVRTQTVSEHKDMYGAPAMLSRVDEFEQWYEPTISPSVDVEQWLPHAYLKDKTSHGLGLFWTGAYQASGGYYADSSFSAPTYDLVKAEYIPPAPAYFNTLAGTAAVFTLEYHIKQKPVYKLGEGDTTWLSSALMPGQTIKVIPLGLVRNDENIGMFAVDATHVEIYGYAVFIYDYNTGSINFGRWVSLPNGEEKIRVQIPVDHELESNALVIYGGIKWDDVKEKARAQRKALADPNDPAHDPLMKAILDALTPQE